jgi:hypothetical protein
MRAQVLKTNENINASLGSKEWKKMLKGFSREDEVLFRQNMASVVVSVDG